MFVPDLYEPPDATWVRELVEGNPLALLVTEGPEGPHATHLPTVLRPGTVPASGELAGAVVAGHMNRANPHWRSLTGPTEALLVFTGPHGYVSPEVYETRPAAPTWNFTAVHVRGTLRPLAGGARTAEVITSTVTALEGRFGRGWDMGPSLEYFDTILPGVGAFEIAIRSAEAMFKLSQEKPPEVRARVHRSFAQGACPGHRGVAGLMAALDPPENAPEPDGRRP